MDNYAKKNYIKFVVAPTRQTVTLIMLKLFLDLIPLLKVDRFEGLLNRCKIDRMVNHILSSCNSKSFLKIKKDDLQYLNKPTS